jgi:hypothetical protein
MPDDTPHLNAPKTQPVRGRPFVKGHPGGPGRPRRSIERDYLDATVGAVPVSKWVKVVKKALEQALRGDAKAREWLSKMLVGSDPIPLAQLAEQLRAELERLTPRVLPPEPRNGKPLIVARPLGPDAECVPRPEGGGPDPEPGGR